MHRRTWALSLRPLPLGMLFLSLALGALPAAARTSRDAPTDTGLGKLGPDLYQAINRGDLAGVQSLLARGADPNSRDHLGGTALFAAAGSGQLPIVEALLRAGARPDENTIYGTPLAAAVAGGSAPVAQLLLTRGADVNSSRPDGTTVLMDAAGAGDPEIVRELLSRKAAVNTRDSDGATPLIDAARGGHLEAGRLLLAAGAVVDATDSHRWTALMEAAVNGHAEFVRLLLARGAQVNARDEKGRTALLLAAACGDDPAVVRALLDGGADPGATDPRRRTALDLAMARGYEQTAALLRDRGGQGAPAGTREAGDGSSVTPAGEGSRTPSAAVAAGLTALQRSMGVFQRMTGCVSCHQHGLARMATGVARQHGWAIDAAVERAEAERVNTTLAELRPLHLRALRDPRAMKDVPIMDIADLTTYYAYMLTGMTAHGQPANPSISAAAMVLARQQFPDGHWFSGPRGPMQSSLFTMTALTIQALRSYGPRDYADEVANRLRRARAWLLTTPAQTSEDKAFRLLGLKWAGASLEERRKAIDELRADQRPDGGWPQPTSPRSDAYGTGQALYALHVAGETPVTDPLFQRGVRFLLRTQEQDGSWFVPKRVLPLNNYFDADFPHGESQYASFNATCWATMALLQTMDRPGPPQAARQRDGSRRRTVTVAGRR